MAEKIEKVDLIKTILHPSYGLIRIPNPANTLPKYLFNLPKGIPSKVNIRYKTGKIIEANLIHNRISGHVFGLSIPPSILKQIQLDFYYSWAIIFNKTGARGLKTGESFEIVAPKTKSGYFHIKNLQQKHDFKDIKNIILERQKTYKSNIKGKFIYDQSAWIDRSKLKDIQLRINKNKPAIYYLTNSDYSEFYIGQSKSGIDALTLTGLHRDHFDWKYFRYTQYNLDNNSKIHTRLLDQIEGDHIHNFSKMVACGKVKTHPEYSINAFYTKVNGVYKPVKILNTDWVDGRRKNTKL